VVAGEEDLIEFVAITVRSGTFGSRYLGDDARRERDVDVAGRRHECGLSSDNDHPCSSPRANGIRPGPHLGTRDVANNPSSKPRSDPYLPIPQIAPQIQEECRNSKECAPALHHFQACSDKVNAGKGWQGGESLLLLSVLGWLFRHKCLVLRA
jgi:hypothetical protein